MKILILGAGGLLGGALRPYLELSGFDIITCGRSGDVEYKVDFSNFEHATELLNKIKPEIIINLIGLVDVEYCEVNSNESYLSNTLVVENIVCWIEEGHNKSHLIHISTDQFYNDLKTNTEDKVVLMNYYSFSKYSGELVAKRIDSTILRTNFFGRCNVPGKESFTDWLYNSLVNNIAIKVFKDVYFSPLSMQTLSEMIAIVIQKKPIGVFNLGSKNGLSKADFSFQFAKEVGFSTESMTPVFINDVSFIKAKRPNHMQMDSSKFEEILNVKLPSIESEIKIVAKEYSK